MMAGTYGRDRRIYRVVAQTGRPSLLLPLSVAVVAVVGRSVDSTQAPSSFAFQGNNPARQPAAYQTAARPSAPADETFISLVLFDNWGDQRSCAPGTRLDLFRRRRKRGQGDSDDGSDEKASTSSRSASVISSDEAAHTVPERFVLVDEVYGAAAVQRRKPRGAAAAATSTTNAGRFVESAFTGFITKRTEEVQNLQVALRQEPLAAEEFRADDGSLSLGALFFRGEVGTVDAKFDKVVFPRLSISGGGTLSAVDLKLAPLSFLPGPLGKSKRFPAPFDLQATDCVLTAEDVRESELIRIGLQRLLNRIARRMISSRLPDPLKILQEMVRVSVREVNILDDQKLSCKGVVTLRVGGGDVPFEVRTGLKLSSRGHVLEFPGMEMILYPEDAESDIAADAMGGEVDANGGPPSVALPLHKWHPVDLDIGSGARIERLDFGSKNGQNTITASVRVTITPTATELDHYKQRRDAFAARYACDMARWLSVVLRFRPSAEPTLTN